MKDILIPIVQMSAVIFIFYWLLLLLHRFSSPSGDRQRLFHRKTKKSFVEFLSALVSSCYSIYLIHYFYSLGFDLSSSIATAIVTPHILCCVLGSVFMWIGFFGNSKAMALTGAILYCVAAVLFITYAPFTIPSVVLGFVGYSRICRVKSLSKEPPISVVPSIDSQDVPIRRRRRLNHNSLE